MVTPSGGTAGRDTARAGLLALVLHAHLPFVRHPEHERFLEEDWLFEAITECYLPILDCADRLRTRGVPFRLTMSLSPTLLCMLSDDLLRRRNLENLDRSIELADRELRRTEGSEEQRLARMYRARLVRARRKLTEQYGGDLVGAFADLARAGHLEILTCAATHAYLPLYEPQPRIALAQLRAAVEVHRQMTGFAPRGIWLPECGFFRGLDRLIAAAGLEHFVLEAHGLLHGTPRPRFGVFAPVATDAGAVAFGRELSSSRQVWSSVEGYPGDPDYREFYRDIGFDLPLDYLRPFIQATGDRKATGFKYYRITGPGPEKELYRPERAVERAESHARHFVAERVRQFETLSEAMDGRPPVVVAPYDAELFGHWWYEGPHFLEHLFVEAAQQGLRTATLAEAIEAHPRMQRLAPAPSSWGEGGFNQVWLNKSNDWLVPQLHRAGEEMLAMADRYPDAPSELRLALDQAARELMLAQASDWPFILKTKTAVDYATRRVEEHIKRFWALLAPGGAALAREIAIQDNLFPSLDYRCYREDYRSVCQ